VLVGLGSEGIPRSLADFDLLDPLLREHRLVLLDLADHRLGCLALEEELDDRLSAC
jgi:hypothetical protein